MTLKLGDVIRLVNELAPVDPKQSVIDRWQLYPSTPHKSARKLSNWIRREMMKAYHQTTREPTVSPGLVLHRILIGFLSVQSKIHEDESIMKTGAGDTASRDVIRQAFGQFASVVWKVEAREAEHYIYEHGW